MTGSSPYNKLFLIGIISIISIVIFSAIVLACEAGSYTCPNTAAYENWGDASICIALDANPNEDFSRQCHADFNWWFASPATISEDEWQFINQGLLANDPDYVYVGYNNINIDYMLSYSIDYCATRIFMLTNIDTRYITNNRATIYSRETNIDCLSASPENTFDVQCYQASGICFYEPTIQNTKATFVNQDKKNKFDIVQTTLAGTKITLNQNIIQIDTEQATNIPATEITCQDQEMTFRFFSNRGMPNHIACDQAQKGVEIGPGTDLRIINREGYNFGITSYTDNILVGLTESREVDILVSPNGTNIEVIENPSDFDIFFNCGVYRWRNGNFDFSWNDAHPADTASSCLDPTHALRVIYNGKSAIIGPACYIPTETNPDICYNFGSQDDNSDICLCQELVPPIPIYQEENGTVPTAENCAELVGLPAEYDLTMEQIVQLCASSGGEYCPNYQYDTICLRKAKGRPVPEDASAWVYEITNNVDRCRAGEIVACANGGVPTAENCAELVGIPESYDLTEREMKDLCESNGGNYCDAIGTYETVCMRKAKGRPVPEDPSQWISEIIERVDACRAGEVVGCTNEQQCGDGICNINEQLNETETCPQDCGNQTIPPPQTNQTNICVLDSDCSSGTCSCSQKYCIPEAYALNIFPPPGCIPFGEQSNTPYCKENIDTNNILTNGGQFAFVVYDNKGGNFAITPQNNLQSGTCQNYDNFGNTTPFTVTLSLSPLQAGTTITLPATTEKYALLTYGSTGSKAYLCPVASLTTCNAQSDCGIGNVCGCAGGACSLGNTCGNTICEIGEVNTCPQDCTNITTGNQCIPGKKEQCFTTPEDTSCFMMRTCSQTGLWGNCTIADQVCEEACTSGSLLSCPRQYGVCAGSKQTCTDETWQGCDYNSINGYETEEQSCDNLDNDCDGVTDEVCLCGIGSSRQCGTNTGECSAGMQACTEGTYNSTCVGGNGPTQELCGDGKDNDCDGSVDEGCLCGDLYGEGFNRTCGQNSCGSGIQTCEQQGNILRFSECIGAPTPAFEVCGDNLDNDCDGSIDEGCGCIEDRACGPEEKGICKAGIQVCGPDNLYGTCTGATYPQAEACGDKLDNDCDGSVDEGCPCSNGDILNCSGFGVCKTLTVSCTNGTFPACNYTNIAAYEPLEKTCTDLLDNDCDNSTDSLDLNCIQESPSTLCSDGTANKQCSTTKPNYCDGGTLTPKCSTCLCPNGMRCDITGKCVEEYIPPTTNGNNGGNNGNQNTCNNNGICDIGETTSCSDCNINANLGENKNSQGSTSTVLLGIILIIAGGLIALVSYTQKKKPNKKGDNLGTRQIKK